MSIVLIAAMSLLALVAAAAILLPLVRGPRQEASRREHDLTVYRDQLEEVERELAAGRIGSSQAAARAEIERRILRVVEAPPGGESAPAMRPIPRMAAWALALAVPVAAAVIYLSIGSPGMPDAPYASRVVADPEQIAQRQEFERLTERLAERLQKGEGDLTGWVMLARSFRTLGRNEESAAAFRTAVGMAGGLDGAPPALLEDFGEALFMVSGGQVTPEARRAFEAAWRREPQLFRARHYLAVAHLQSGEPEQALAIWRGMALDSPADAPWLPELRRRMEDLAAEIGIAATDVPPQRSVVPGATPVEGAPDQSGPTRADMEAAAGMSAEERAAFIRGMVERLASRLEESPEDPEGWARLARAYSVLGNDQKAAEAREHALSQFRRQLEALPPDSPERAAIEARLSALEEG